MTTIEQIAWLRERCVAFGVEFNEHRNYYQSLESFLDERPGRCNGVDAELRAEILAAGQLVLVQCYPNTPISFLCIVHHDFEKAIAAAYERLSVPQSSENT